MAEMTEPQPNPQGSLDPIEPDVAALRARVAALERDRDALRRQDEAAARRETELRRHNEVLRRLSRSEALGRGDLIAAFGEITEAAAHTLAVERVGIWLFAAGRTTIRCLDLYERSRDVHTRGLELKASDYPAYFRALEGERSIAAHDAQNDPRTSEFRSVYLAPLGITAMMDAGIRIAGRPTGIVCHEHVGAARRWTLAEQAFAGSMADFASMALQANRQSIMLRELDHRVKNNLAIVMALAEQTLDAAGDLDSFATAFLGRLGSLAIAHELLAGRRWEGAELREMIERLTGAYRRGAPNRCRLEGGPVVVPRDVAPSLCMVLHELLTNAAKHGALSVSRGSVAIQWSVDDRERLHLQWVERGGPTVIAPSASACGFGTELLEHLVSYQLHGTSEVGFDPEGVRCSIMIPLGAFARRDLIDEALECAPADRETEQR
jgi:two-component sensor histidine kinase